MSLLLSMTLKYLITAVSHKSHKSALNRCFKMEKVKNISFILPILGQFTKKEEEDVFT